MEAHFNAPRLPRVHLGMSMDEVSKIMEKPAQRREAEGTHEIWYYMSDYDAEMMTAIHFENGRVAKISQEPWQEPE
jgi:hypothetical protein